jgi:hypothetical protein
VITRHPLAEPYRTTVTMHTFNAPPWDLPVEVLETLVAQLSPTSRGLARHVSREFRVAVRAVEEADDPVGGKSRAKRNSRMEATCLCRSSDLVRWAWAQACPWSLRVWLEKAAGEPPWKTEIRHQQNVLITSM